MRVLPAWRRRLAVARRAPGVTAVLLISLALPRDAPAAAPLSLRVDKGDVRVTVPLRPGGAFEAKTTSLGGTVTVGAGRPLPLTGDLAVDLATVDTGIDLRNRHLREKYLELARGTGFDRAVLSDLRLSDADSDAFRGRTAFTAFLLLHGVRQPVSGTGEIRAEGPTFRVDASFPLTLTDFGITPPEYLGVGVANRLLVTVRFTARPVDKSGP